MFLRYRNTDYTNAVKGNCVPLLILMLCLTDHLYCDHLGLIPGLMRPSRSRTGVPTVEMEMKAGVTAPEQGATTTGGSTKKAPTRWAGTATATAPAPDVGASRAEPTPAAATPGWAAADQILQTRALRTRAPTGASRSTKPILRVTTRAGASR